MKTQLRNSPSSPRSRRFEIVLVSLFAMVLGLGNVVFAENDAESKTTMIECKMTYKLQGWSLIVKTASGNGTIRCSDGEEALVKLELRGGGLTAGKTTIDDGVGNFSDVASIDELFGHYAAAEVSAGVVKASQALVLTRGNVSLALAAVGRGWDLGVSGLRLTIEGYSEEESDD